jgi:hypothetical protein
MARIRKMDSGKASLALPVRANANHPFGMLDPGKVMFVELESTGRDGFRRLHQRANKMECRKRVESQLPQT